MDNAELLSTYSRKPSRRLRDRIVFTNFGLVRNVAHRLLKTCKESYEDLEQVGVIGLCKAIEGFDLKKGYTFASYAIPKIESEIRHHIRDKTNPVKVPRRWQDKRRKFLEMYQAGSPPEEISLATKIKPEEQADAAMALQYRAPIALDQPYGEGGTPLIDSIEGSFNGHPSIVTIDDLLRWIAVDVDQEGWVNVTPICKEEKKVFHEFARLPSTKFRIKELARQGSTQVIYSKRGRQGGSWVHKSLAPDFLIWVNPAKYQSQIMDVIVGNLESA